MSKITINIDEKEYTAESGQTILEVARENDIEIPALCYRENISKTTSCFVCVVRDKNNGRFLPSCSTVAAEGMEIEADSEAVYNMRQNALNLLLSEHDGDCEAPCVLACPAQARVEDYVQEGKKGNHLQALKIIKERIPLPMSIGRVCPRFCEDDCRRNVIDEKEPVAINDFKRLAADLHYENYREKLPTLGNKNVAVVGGGPAGLAVSYFLRKEGVASHIFDKMPQPGGMLRYGIPEFRLPKDILDKELAHFEKMGGIDFHTQTEVGRDIELNQLQEDYDAVVVTVGSWQSRSLRIEGEELASPGIDFLKQKNKNNPGKTIVIGGGNTAIDCVRTAVRLTEKQVACFYRRTEKEMPAEHLEIKDAREEGISFEFLTQPVALKEEADSLLLKCVKMKLGEPDASGRRRPIPIEGSEFTVKADTVITAIGQQTAVPEGVKTNRWGDADVEKKSLRVKGNLFAAGDCVTGPATVVEAVAAGRKAALNIQAFLNDEKYQKPFQINVSRGSWQSLSKDDLVLFNEPVTRKRQPYKTISLDERKNSFKEVTRTFSEKEIADEGERCLECSCTALGDCLLKSHSENYKADPEKISGVKPDHNYDKRHPEIIMDQQKCIKCAICVKTCKEIVNESLLGFKNRGFSTSIGTSFAEGLPLSCRDCGECIETCPTGALDWKQKNNN